ncbi:hypothetical protein [Paenibacillus macquariensis]|uniref:Uncharacterized protein n=1 Tax=Paenibacillus macquariensis TaxID=948756 RepID=A0ABY1JNW0_9BACL|nr:hypothetical protein [Paenibacillus macquariensis]MEC0092098.1 hypothetical protein [Paenibacillus macquariensis]OAB37338.1 hypothetical protein PMSM_04530 [Paenibacillus macquariensis subsp. macquariensis]SIQ51150.1 hypothetical protein SAMN05421578_102333 [Paenibacillus macquariensis]
MTEELALHAVVILTGIPANLLLVDAQSYEDCFVVVSNLSKKTYHVELTQKVNSYTAEETKDMKMVGEYDGLSVYEMIPWWNELV